MRLTLCAAVALVFGAAAFFIVQSEQQIGDERARSQAFDRASREVGESLARARSAQQAYVAEGQDAAFWIPEVAKSLDAARAGIDQLRESARDAEIDAMLEGANGGLAELRDIDRRAREYLTGGQALMAADVVFAEGAESAAVVTRQVQAASLADSQAVEAFESRRRRVQLASLGGAGLVAIVIVAFLATGRTSRVVDDSPARLADAVGSGFSRTGVTENDTSDVRRTSSQPLADRISMAAAICTDFGRVTKSDDLPPLMARIAEALQATGLIVWIGDATGGELRPAIAHGYSPAALTRLPAIPATADNAAAAAYRTGTPQIVRPRTQEDSGALVAPLLAASGCIGALTVEVARGVPIADELRALAAVFAAQLATVVAPSTALTKDFSIRSASA
jgi:hypothetical protein